tara:strand:- start:1659 stop:2531 length:873 start_codon:yes stop_codon:yes gene_type:complete
VRLALERGMREHIYTEFRTNGVVVPVVYWITPKAAHTLIANHKLTRGPWRTLNVSLGHFGVDRTHYGTAVKVTAATDVLEQFVAERQPFEFTFVRDPVFHLVSAAAQVLDCARRLFCICAFCTPPRLPPAVCPQPLTNASTVLYYAEMALRNLTLSDNPSGRTIDSCARHLWPQGWGYAFDPRGAARLDFVGKMETFEEDWTALEAALRARAAGQAETQRTKPAAHKHVNSRRHATDLKQGGDEYALLEQDPLVRRALAWDRECLFGAAQSATKRFDGAKEYRTSLALAV